MSFRMDATIINSAERKYIILKWNFHYFAKIKLNNYAFKNLSMVAYIIGTRKSKFAITKLGASDFVSTIHNYFAN